MNASTTTPRARASASSARRLAPRKRLAIIALRCCKLSDRFEDFWQRRSGPPRAAAA
jgi:hypothetical protein